MVTEMITAISICVVLPVLIVFIVFRFITFKTQKQSDIIMEAMKNNPNIDTKELIKAFQSKQGKVWRNLSRKLLRGCIFTLMGVALIIIACFIPINDSIGLWIVGSCTASVGIGFLITYWFAYLNRNNFKEDYECHNK